MQIVIFIFIKTSKGEIPTKIFVTKFILILDRIDEYGIFIFKKLNLNYKLKTIIKPINIDDIYVEIIKDLIIENKIKDYGIN